MSAREQPRERGRQGRRIVVVPPAPVLLGEYASLTDPVTELRRACEAAVAWLDGGGDGDVRVLADDEQDRRVGEELLGRASVDAARDVLVMANGSARRSEKAPGHLDPRAADFDARVGDLLAAGDLAGLAAVEPHLAQELLASGLAGFALLHDEGVEVTEVDIEHAEDPFGVMYWVVRLKCGS